MSEVSLSISEAMFLVSADPIYEMAWAPQQIHAGSDWGNCGHGVMNRGQVLDVFKSRIVIVYVDCVNREHDHGR